MEFSGKNTGVDSHSPQGLNLGALHCRQILYCLSHQESPLSGDVYLFNRYVLMPPHALSIMTGMGKD